jgi:hypothetical protein
MKEQIKASWGWCGLEPDKIIEINPFGNVIVKDTFGKYWRICPEELKAEIIADSDDAFKGVRNSKDFLVDWEMKNLVNAARKHFGSLDESRCFCLKMPGVLGGRYDLDNIGTISVLEVIKFSGDAAQQIKDLPDGTKVEFKFVD